MQCSVLVDIDELLCCIYIYILYCALGHRELIVLSAVIGDMMENVIVLSIVVE